MGEHEKAVHASTGSQETAFLYFKNQWLTVMENTKICLKQRLFLGNALPR